MAAAKTTSNIFAVISLFQLIGCVNIDFEPTRSLAPFSTTAEPGTLTSLNAIVSDLLARVASLEAFVKSESKENKLNGFNTKPAMLPPCHKFGDTHGTWVKSESALQHPRLRSHFFASRIGEAANFTHLWLPHDCSYMRFTNESILKSVDYLLEKRNMSKPSLTIVFLGDSVTKAIVCGIARVLAGSEVYGEIANPVCGGGPFGIVLAHKLTGWINLDFGRLRLTYLFQKSFHARLDHLDWKLEWAITQMKPFAVILNTGAWDFQPEGENPPVKVEGQEHCTSEHTEAISIARADGSVNKTMWEWGIEAQKLNISVYYRNIHFNSRFGALCADERVEKILEGSPWQIMDSRRISRDVWNHQVDDGLHFDTGRRHAHTAWENQELRDDAVKRNVSYPGELEMQLTQSFLNAVFYDSLDIHWKP